MATRNTCSKDSVDTAAVVAPHNADSRKHGDGDGPPPPIFPPNQTELLERMIRVETLRQLDLAWAAQRRLALRCVGLRVPVPPTEEDKAEGDDVAVLDEADGRTARPGVPAQPVAEADSLKGPEGRQSPPRAEAKDDKMEAEKVPVHDLQER